MNVIPKYFNNFDILNNTLTLIVTKYIQKESKVFLCMRRSSWPINEVKRTNSTIGNVIKFTVFYYYSKRQNTSYTNLNNAIDIN